MCFAHELEGLATRSNIGAHRKSVHEYALAGPPTLWPQVSQMAPSNALCSGIPTIPSHQTALASNQFIT